MQFGIRLHDAVNVPIEERLKVVKEQGFSCAHVALSKVISENSVADSALTPGYAMYYVWMIPHLENNPWTKTRIYDPEHEWVNSDKLDVFKF